MTTNFYPGWDEHVTKPGALDKFEDNGGAYHDVKMVCVDDGHVVVVLDDDHAIAMHFDHAERFANRIMALVMSTGAAQRKDPPHGR